MAHPPTNFQHPDIFWLEDPVSFCIVMLKREVMVDLQIVWKMREFENRYERYERYMKQWYHHEDDWPMFDEDYWW
jgi:hypothetical protein